MRQNKKTLRERFEERVELIPFTTCHIWTGATNGYGYGEIRRNGRKNKAHRISYELYKGPIPDGLIIRHTCDNPPCVNPDHLLTGTKSDNMQDSIARGRDARGETTGTSKLKEWQVREIRTMGGTTAAAVGKLFGVHRRTITDIRLGKTWKHIK